MNSGNTVPPGPLSDLKVVDLTGPIGVFCGKLLADMGANVIKIEPPGGDPMRQRGPFYDDDPAPEKSLYWWQFNTSKRGVTLNLDHPRGREMFLSLVKGTDIVLESFEPGYLDSLGLGFNHLRQANPRVILASITPFGQEGPYSRLKATDIVGQAMGGITQLVGLPHFPPYQINNEVGYWAASMHTANALMMATIQRDRDGEGQHIDTSMQAAMAVGTAGMMPTYDIMGQVLRRGEVARGRSAVRNIYPCKDGQVYFLAAAPGTSLQAVWDLLREHGLGDDFDERWLDADLVREDPKERQAFQDVMLRFFADKTKVELLELSFNRDRQVFTVPTATPEDVVKSPHLQDRRFFQDVEHPELGVSIKYPGPPVRLPESPWAISRRPPLIGEHNEEVYGETLGIQREELEELQREGVI